MSNGERAGIAEVCQWKNAVDEETRGMSRAEMIAFFQKRANEIQKKLGLELVCLPASTQHDPAENPAG